MDSITFALRDDDIDTQYYVVGTLRDDYFPEGTFFPFARKMRKEIEALIGGDVLMLLREDTEYELDIEDNELSLINK